MPWSSMSSMIRVNATVALDDCRNLIENSIRYGGDGITIHVDCHSSDGMMHFTYYDNGKGVSDEHLEKIFERFYRIPDEKSHRAEGSELGLSMTEV